MTCCFVGLHGRSQVSQPRHLLGSDWPHCITACEPQCGSGTHCAISNQQLVYATCCDEVCNACEAVHASRAQTFGELKCIESACFLSQQHSCHSGPWGSNASGHTATVFNMCDHGLQVRFCGPACHKKAWKAWHKVECQEYQLKKASSGSAGAAASSSKS